MYLAWFRPICFTAAVLIASSGSRPLRAEAASSLTAAEVIQRAVARAQQAEVRTGRAGYTYTKLTVTEELDATGKVKQRKEKVYQVYFQRGATYLKLLTVNGRPPAHADARKQAENEKESREMLGSSKARNADNRENFLTPELVARFNFTLVDQQTLDGRPAYQLTFAPKQPAPPVHHIVDRLLNRISGTVWIDAEEFEIARAEISLGSEVDFLGGVVGSLKKLAYSMTRTRVGDGFWFNTLSTGDFEGRKLLDSMRIKTKSQSTNFRPLRLAS